MKNFGASSNIFITSNDAKWEVIGEGLKRQIMGYDDKIMLVHVKFEKGAVGTLHDHYHSQVTWVQDGEFEVSIDGDKKILKAGDCFYIPPHVTHGAVCLSAGTLIDVFSPIREDFMK